MLNVLIDMPPYEPAIQTLQGQSGINVTAIEAAEKVRLLPPEQITECDVLFCTFPPENHALMSRLKLIQISSAGYTQVVGQGLVEREVRVCNALGVFDVPIAEWNVAMMINLARDLRGMIRHQEARHWERAARFQNEIRGAVVGIWGYGGIGRETARQCKALGLKVHVLSRNGIQPRENIYCVPGTGDQQGILPDRVFLADEKEAFLKGLDFLVLAMPQTESTEGIMGEAELQMLGPHAYVLNPARGPLIQEQALLRALREDWIAGAALDTHYQYPLDAEHPLWAMPNVLLTPHISGSSASPHFLERVYDIFSQNVKRLITNQPLLNELTSSQLRGGNARNAGVMRYKIRQCRETQSG